MRESKMKPAGSGTFTFKNKVFELPAFDGTEGPTVIDIQLDPAGYPDTATQIPFWGAMANALPNS